jgi:hypothetical protein
MLYFLFTVMGMMFWLNSSIAISSGSINDVLINNGAPIDICRALAPIILALSYRVYDDIINPQVISSVANGVAEIRTQVTASRTP